MCFLLASLTDFLDGFIARRRQQVTRLGKLLDPAADKLLTSAAFISLVELESGSGLDGGGHHRPRVRRFLTSELWRRLKTWFWEPFSSAKVKTVLQIIAISLLIIYNQLGAFEHLAPISLWLAMLASLYSGVEYFVRFAPQRPASVWAGPSPRAWNSPLQIARWQEDSCNDWR